MTQKPYACFGYVFLANMFDAGDVFYAKKTKESTDTLLATKGFLKVYDKDSGELIEEVYPGWFAAPYNDVHHRIEAIEPSVIFCFAAALNKGFVPPLEPITIPKDGAHPFPAQTKFFLCEGTVVVGNKKMTGPCQIIVQAAQNVGATTDAYGVIVK